MTDAMHRPPLERSKAKVIKDMLLALVLAAAFLAIPAFFVNHFYRSLSEPDPRDELPQVRSEFSAITTALGKARGQEFLISKGSILYISQRYAGGGDSNIVSTARLAALANNYHEPQLRADGSRPEKEILMLCSDHSPYRTFNIELAERATYVVSISVRPRIVKECERKR